MTARGGWLLCLLMFLMVLVDVGRHSFNEREVSAFSISDDKTSWVQLRGVGRRYDGIHQINDATEFISVINLAGYAISPSLALELRSSDLVESGKILKCKVKNGDLQSVDVDWMPAAQRMALGIPLQVERMNLSDWVDLPGVGPSLASRIVLFRQKNGENVQFADLKQVPGVGRKTLKRWQPFF